MAYLLTKTFHLLFVIAWMGGVFYLPRILVNLAEAGDVDAHHAGTPTARRSKRTTTPGATSRLTTPASAPTMRANWCRRARPEQARRSNCSCTAVSLGWSYTLCSIAFTAGHIAFGVTLIRFAA